MADEAPITLPGGWDEVLGDEVRQPGFARLLEFVAEERRHHRVYPPPEDVFNAFRCTPFSEAKVLILGQDPYHGPGQAHGLAFSVRPGVRPPPSLANIFRELRDDVGFRIPDNGCLVPWATQGVLLLNAVLTVREGEPGSHARKGWERFTDAAIRALGRRPGEVVFVLWGAHARRKLPLVDPARHTVIEGVHPSPLSANRGFFGSRPFSRVNEALARAGRTPIDWQLPDVQAG